MNMTIQAIKSLELAFSVDVLNRKNIRLLLQATAILKNTACCKASTLSPEELVKMSDPATQTSYIESLARNNLCTWRPTYCLDIFLFLQPDKAVTVAIPMYGMDASLVNDIKYFESHTYNEIEVEDCVCLAHLTCDTDEDNNSTMVVLVYDVIVRSKPMPQTQERYAYLRRIEAALSKIVLGQACVRVQWAGDCLACDKIQQIQLPHAYDSIIIYGDKYNYQKFTIARRSPFPSVPAGPGVAPGDAASGR